MNNASINVIRMIPIYIDIYSQSHFEDYLQRREMELQSKSTITLPSSTINQQTIDKEFVSSIEKIDSPVKLHSSIPILLPPPVDQQTGLC